MEDREWSINLAVLPQILRRVGTGDLQDVAPSNHVSRSDHPMGATSRGSYIVLTLRERCELRAIGGSSQPVLLSCQASLCLLYARQLLLLSVEEGRRVVFAHARRWKRPRPLCVPHREVERNMWFALVRLDPFVMTRHLKLTGGPAGRAHARRLASP